MRANAAAPTWVNGNRFELEKKFRDVERIRVIHFEPFK